MDLQPQPLPSGGLCYWRKGRGMAQPLHLDQRVRFMIRLFVVAAMARYQLIDQWIEVIGT